MGEPIDSIAHSDTLGTLGVAAGGDTVTNSSRELFIGKDWIIRRGSVLGQDKNRLSAVDEDREPFFPFDPTSRRERKSVPKSHRELGQSEGVALISA